MTDTILIVDDEANQRHMLEYTIANKLKYRTLSVSSGQEAISLVLAGEIQPDLILLDMRMPQPDGLQVIRALRPQRPELPIIILTEYGDHDNATLAITAGAVDFLTKPVAVERLSLSITNALRVRHLHQTISRLERQLVHDGVPIPEGKQVLSTPLTDAQGRMKKLRTIEEEAIRAALHAAGGSMTRAARMLGIGRSTLYRKLDEMGRHQPSV
jgi:DNA-binding NtrC family response regulator